MKKTEHCRVCGNPFAGEPLLRYEAMPGMAQHLPEYPDDDRSIDFNVFQCNGCGLVQLDSAPVPYYREVIRAAAFSPEMGDFRRCQFKDWIMRHRLAGRKVLECGCGGGEFLELMAETGAEAYGMEYGEANVERCSSKGLNVEKFYFEDKARILRNGLFDAFYILNYLEHLPNINEYLQGIAANLSDNAVGLVEVPNFDMMLANHTFAEFTSDHLYYFTRQTLSSLLARNGFEVVASETLWYGYIISMEVKKRAVPDFSGFETAREKLTWRLNSLIDKYGPENCAVWGASHQAFAVLALAGLHGKLRCIIDSAPFKQGKISPATHIPIVAPDSLKPGELKLLIAAAGGYSDEVARIARQRFGNALEIYILRENQLEYYTETCHAEK